MDGKTVIGKIVKEDKKGIYVDIEGDIVLIDRKAIKSIQMVEKWDIDGNVKNYPAPKTVSLRKKHYKKNKNFSKETVYFPLKLGNWWKYRVSHIAKNLDETEKDGRKKEYKLEWRISDILKSTYYGQYLWSVQPVYVLEIKSPEKKEYSKKALFVGSMEKDLEKSFLVMKPADSNEGYPFFQRLIPLNPFLKYCRRWVDLGQDTGVKIRSDNNIKGIESVQTDYGFYDDCLIVERIDDIENQVLKTKTLMWFSPKIGLVKMVQETVLPEKMGKRSCVFKKYELVEYGVN